ncbi:Hypothetical predicted protein [Paramuricea clavata]|uniref:DDE Tnp4 domain-containing protein n=1 Tax=Paramuricea clavata TaxID=317549 RepID=A0A6S7GPP6_PARCT|nr:Hypothetical predicted protein [Paramuricea clavata]
MQEKRYRNAWQLLNLPPKFVCPQGSVCSGIEGLCICLKRLAYPCRYSDLIYRFGKPPPVLSMIHNEVDDFIYNEHGHLVTRWNQHSILSPRNLQKYADAIHAKGAALDNCFGFVDGTVRPICRPKKLQRSVYNGHKRVHAIKFQSVSLPNGLIGHLYRPVEGKRHDASMLAESGLLADLERFAFSEEGQPMCIYGDPAYPSTSSPPGPF